MKQSYVVLTAKLTNGKLVVAKNNNKEEVTLYVDSKSNNFWLTKEAIELKAISPVAVLETTEKGDTFTANRDSKRTKLQGWVSSNPDKDPKDCTLDKKIQGEPLYFKDEIVHRAAGQTILSGFISIDEYKVAKEMQSVGM